MKFYTFEGMVGYWLIKFFQLFPIKRKIVFVSFNGNYISDSPKEIYLKLLGEKSNYKYIWLVKDKTKTIEGATSIKIKSIKALYHLATARAWVDNCRKREWMTKRKQQFYLQTWHGGIGMKKSEAQIEDKLDSKYIQSAKNDSRMIDAFVSGSRWCTELYSTWFYYHGPIIETGCPRSDIFYKNEEWSMIKNKVYKYFGIESGKKLILYAPTFRQNYKINREDFLPDEVAEYAKQRFGGEWIIGFRLHPNVCSKYNEIEYSNRVFNASLYESINDLIIACDILVTDYSSCMFDGLEAGKKVMLYVPDYESFIKSRELSWSLNDLPFPYASSLSDMEENIITFNEEKYFNQCNCFKRKCGFLNSAESSKKVADYLLEKIGE